MNADIVQKSIHMNSKNDQEQQEQQDSEEPSH